jgi:hypothetical protein
MTIDRATRLRRYRRYLAGMAIIWGMMAGVGLGSLAALVGSPGPILLLAIPLGVRVVGPLSGKLTILDRVGWLWPLVALPVAMATFVLMPPDLAPIALGLAVAGWFAFVVLTGVLEVVLDPDGRLASGTE